MLYRTNAGATDASDTDGNVWTTDAAVVRGGSVVRPARWTTVNNVFDAETAKLGEVLVRERYGDGMQ